jgi:O-antigen/teichoic acid export membrane protein
LQLDDLDVERGAVRGTALLVGRFVALQGITGIATIAIAHLLSPSDYGAFAVAYAVQLFARSAIDLGLVAALVQRPSPPTPHEQQAATGFMLLAGIGLAAAASGVAFGVLPAIGSSSQMADVTAVACLSLPFLALRAIPMALLDRDLNFGKVTVVEFTETIGFYSFALTAAIAGLGPFSLGGAVPFSFAVGAVAALFAQPWSYGARIDLRGVAPLLIFGFKATAQFPLYFLREMGVVLLLATVASQAAAGFYGISQRVFVIPTVIFFNVQRVALAALARLAPGPARGARAATASQVVAVATGFPLAVLVGAAHPLIAVLFGQRWLPAFGAVVTAAPGVFLASSMGAVLIGLAIADRRPNWLLFATGMQAAVTIGLAVPLVAAAEATGAGIASGTGFILFTALMVARAPSGARTALIPVLRSLGVAALAAGAGWLAGHGTDVESLIAALAAGSASWIALSALLTRSDLRLLLRLLRRHIRRPAAA